MKAVNLCKKGIRTFAACLALSGALFFGMSDTASAAEVVPSADVLVSSEEMGVATQANVNLKWYYAIKNGKLYKRLHDENTDVWLTDWIYVRDL